jgi:hypothetical protein
MAATVYIRRSSLAAGPITRPDKFACRADKDWMMQAIQAGDGRKPDGGEARAHSAASGI